MRTAAMVLAFGLLTSTVQETFARVVASRSLYSQAAAHAIELALTECTQSSGKNGIPCSQRANVSYLLLDAQSGAVLSSDWPNSDSPIPLGSLVKPFTALAYGEKHQFKFPAHICRGTVTGCWRPRGHGRVDLESAIANSCNSYFRALTRNMTASDLHSVTAAFGLQPPGPDTSGAELAGLGGHWVVSPMALARAYIELAHRANQTGIPEILAGMAQSARTGTGMEANRALRHTSALAKTGTAPCTHLDRAPGDGFVVVMLPAERPDILLMLRVHGEPGSHAAKLAGQLLQGIDSGQ